MLLMVNRAINCNATGGTKTAVVLRILLVLPASDSSLAKNLFKSGHFVLDCGWHKGTKLVRRWGVVAT
jgi:hypothetical protein